MSKAHVFCIIRQVKCYTCIDDHRPIDKFFSQFFVSPCNTRALTRYYCELADRINCRARDEARTCGSDGKTYYNMCALNIATCDHPRLHAVHSGPCPTSSTITDIPSVPTQDGLQNYYQSVPFQYPTPLFKPSNNIFPRFYEHQFGTLLDSSYCTIARCKSGKEENKTKMPAKKRKSQETADSKETVKDSQTKKSKKASEADAFKLIVEYWAETVVADLAPDLGEVEVDFNPSKPRRGSFEFTLVKGGKETVIWTGVKKGPPRKMKFPETPDLIIEAIKKNL
ncbi:unnamed protein product [Mytilus edulis]|uniref:Kazal-like domain-containing protein n=1 Tax=Mytilus edulis TaxID=6550 RepID=A0A8S3T532_MYTED|nr:unnamed protein product [Mytilus edulis]